MTNRVSLFQNILALLYLLLLAVWATCKSGKEFIIIGHGKMHEINVRKSNYSILRNCHVRLAAFPILVSRILGIMRPRNFMLREIHYHFHLQ
jgi:hypothetical protein